MQPPSAADQRTTLEAVVKVLWRVTAADEEDPDCRAAIDAILHPPEPPSRDFPDEETEAQTPADGTPATRSTTQKEAEPAAPSVSNGGEHTGDGDGVECRIVWPEVDVELWQRVESMLDIGGGCAVVGNAEFAGWVCSVLQCRPTF